MKKNFRSFSAVTATMLLLLFTHVTARSQSFDFDGVDDKATLSGVLTSQLDNFTLECWVYPRAYNSNCALVISDNQCGIMLSSTGRLFALINNGGPNATETAPLNTWTHIAMVRRSGTWEIYKNGVACNIGAPTTVPSGNTGNWTIGYKSASELLSGAIDEVRFWSVARTAADIANNYNVGISTYSGLVASYRNNAGTPNANNTSITALTDYSGYGHAATLTNTARTGNTSNFVSDFSGPNITFTDGSTYAVSPTAGQTNQVIGRFAMAANTAGGSMTAATIKVNSVPTGYTNFKLWESSDASFGGDVQLGSAVAAYPGNGSSLAYSAFSSTLTTATKYYFLTADLASSVSGGVIPIISGNSSFSFSNALLSGTLANAWLMQNNAALDFDGVNDVATLSGVLTSVVDNFTLESWVYPRAYYSWSWTVSESSKRIGLGYSSNGTLTYLINNGTGQAAGVMVPLNTWTHISLVRRNGTYELYKNGVACTTGQSAAPSGNSGSWNIGYVSSLSESVTGAIDEVRFWNVARTASEIANNYNSSLATIPATLMAYYKMSDGIANQNNTGTTQLIDNSGNSRTATMSNFTLIGVSSNFVPNFSLDPTPIIAVTATVGTTTANYSTLKAAFDAINAGTHKGDIVIKINGSTTETASAVLNASAATSSGSPYYTSVNVYPTTTGLSITGGFAAPLIDLSGADNVTIDGRVNATGATKDLIITNTSAALSSTIRFINDATANTVKYCTLKGSSLDATSGVLFFSTTTGTTGNDGNTIDNNNITNSSDAARPINVVYSNGTAAKTNSGNTLSNNNIYDFLNKSNSSNGIQLNAYNTGWTISGNSFYETASFAPLASVGYYPVLVNQATTTDIAITGNFIGGSAALCGGTAWTKSGASYTNTFKAININVGPTVTSTTSIQGNTIKNFNWTDNANNNWVAISANGTGDINIGTITGNTIGAVTGTGSIVVTSSGTSGSVMVIQIDGSGTVSCQNNTIGAITVANTISTYASHFYGIEKSSSGTTTISNNLVGSTSTANSIICSSVSGSYPQYFYGIASSGTGTVTISGNTLSKLTNNNNIYSGGFIKGILTSSGTNTISNNTIRDLTVTNASIADVIFGIDQSSSTAAAQTVSGNTISNLSNTHPTCTGIIHGIYYNGPATASAVSGNFIHSLTVTGNSGASAVGITIAAGTTTYSNNIISLGGNTTTNLYGIRESAGFNNYYFNTLYIGGVSPGGSAESDCIRSMSANTRNFKNNLFVNARTGNTQYAFVLTNTGGVTIDYNDYYVSSGTLAWYNGTSAGTLTALKTASGQDAHSINNDPAFASAGGTTATNYLPASPFLTGVSGTGIAADYAGTTRTYNSMGAYDYSVSGLVAVTATLGTATGAYANLKAAFDAINAGTHKGVIAIKVNGSTNESASCVLNASAATSSGSPYFTSVNVYPTTTGLSISGSFAAPLIDLSGADNVTIDGRVNATGSTKDLVVTNTSAALSSTIRFINDATANTVQYCTLKGSSLDATSGILFFSTTTGTTGNDGNTIDNNNITSSSDAARPISALYSDGTAAKTNSGNTISNNNIYNFLNKSNSSNGIYLNSSNTGWTISGNSFYETASFAPLATVGYYPILVNQTTTTDIAITGNFIGGSAPLCGGTAWTKSGASYTNAFKAIAITVGPTVTTTTSIQGNTIKNFNWTDNATSSWYAIAANGTGNINIGTVTGNTIGASTGTGSIVVTSTAANGYVYAIHISSSGTVDCQNNTLGAITAANISTTYPSHFYGITKSAAGTTTISNNLIGSTITANSIICSSPSTSYGQYLYGIISGGSGAVTISGNTVSKLTNSNNYSAGGFINGINTASGTNIITNNTIRDLTVSNSSGGAVNVGIFQSSTTAAAQTVSGNTISNLSNTYATCTGIMLGIYYNGPATASAVSGNFIHSLTVTGNSGASVTGILIEAGTTTYSNNIISLGGNTTTNLYGIREAAGTNNYYFNTLYIGGVSPGGSAESDCIRSLSTSARNFKNNLFVNTRTGNTQYGVVFGNLTGVTIDYNDYYVTSGNLAWYNGTVAYTLSALKAASGQDAHSINTNPLFANAGGTTAANYLPASQALTGVSGTGITTDYAGTTRTYNSMGAYDYSVSGLVVVTASLGTATGAYANLKAAFDAINAGTHKGVIAIKINGSTSEGASAVLNASVATSSGIPYYTSVNVYPTATGLSISGNLPSPLIDLNGADNVTIDGRVNATGATKDLIITNTSISATAGTSTVRFINDATANLVKYCSIQGSTTDVSAGILFFSTTTGTTGNDDNIIDNNNITNSLDANRPLRVVLSYGTINKTNSGNTISNNNIYNFLNKATASSGIMLSGYNTGWTISGNSFYETTSFAPTASVEYVSIYVSSVTSSDITISGNFIGGSAALCGGTAWTKTSAATSSFKGIYLVNGPTVSTTTSVQGNTIKNMAWSDAGTSDWFGIYALSSATGDINIGTISGNIIGAATGTGSLVVTSSVINGYVFGIRFDGTGMVNCQNNTIGAITVANTNATNPSHFYGIFKSGAGTTNISNNLIGSTSTANSIICSSVSGSYAQYLSGIYSVGTGTVTISGNTVSKLTNNNNVTAGGFIKGIYTHTGTNIITNNTIRDLTTPNFYAGAGASSTIIGIAQISTTAAAQTISGNTIYNLSNTNASFAGSITGIYYTGPATASTVSGNFIHSLTASGNIGSGMGAILSGIYIDAGTTTYSNNIVSLGGNTGNTLFGIYDNGGTNNYYFNTLYIGGTPTTGSNASYGLYRSYSNTIICRNNLMITTRSNAGSALGTHTAATFVNTTVLTTDYNNYFATGTGSLLGWWAGSKSTLAQIQAVGQDAHSMNTDPAFASAGGTLATNYQVGATLPGITIAGITNDYAGTTRAGTPTMGAYEKGLFSQVVTFTAITAKSYGDADFTPAVTASSGLTAFTYTCSNTAVATINSTTGLVHIVGAGMANITATQAGNATWASASASSSLTVIAKALTLASAVAQNKSYDGTNAAVLTGTLTGIINSDDVTVAKTGTFAAINMGTGIAVTSTSTLGGTKAGNYSLTQPTGLTANITGGIQIITFGALASKTYGDAPFIVSATGGASGNPVTFISSDPTVALCTGATGSTVTILKAGSCSIYADQAGNSLYAAATQVAQTLTIAKATQIITLSPLPVGSQPLNTFTTIQVTATSNSGLTVAISLGAGSAATLNGSNQLENIGITGTVVINLTVAANDNYNAASSSYTFDVVKSNQSITFGVLSGVTYTSGLTVDMSGKATASSSLAVCYSVVSGPATITGTTLNISGAGVVVVAASQAGDASWNPAADVTQTLTVSQSTQTITFASLAAKNYGDAAFTLSATGGGSGNAVTFSSSDPTVASCDGTNGAFVTILKAGSCTIYADQAGNSSYTAAAQVSQSLTINKGDQLLTLGSLPVGNLPLNQFTDPIQVTATSTSGLTVTIFLGGGSAATLNGSNQLVSIGQTGTVFINLSQDGNDNYNAATGSYAFDVTKSNQSITFGALANKTNGDPDYSPGATASSLLAVSYSSSNTAVATIISGQIHIVGSGTTTITASQSGDATWNPALDVGQSLKVFASQTITFGALAAKTYGDAPFSLTGSASSGLTVTYASSNTNVATVSGSTVTILQGGNTNITASQAGNENYGAAPDVIQLLTINQAPQSITFGALLAKTYGDADFAPGATSATSGINAITYASSNTAVATIVSGLIHIVSAGTANITASQGASTNYTVAPNVTQGLTVNAIELSWTGNTNSNWNTATNWSPNAIPTSGYNATITSGPSNQPIVNEDPAIPAVCYNLTVGTGAVVTIAPGKALTVSGTLDNGGGNAGLVIESAASLMHQSNDVAATVKWTITGSASLTALKYHFVSIPTQYAAPTTSLFLDSYLYDLDPTQLTGSAYGKWVGFGTSTSTSLSAGKGYMIYYPGDSHEYTFTGNLNNGTYDYSLTGHAGAGVYTYNLVPNPYPSSIVWNTAGAGWATSAGIGGTCYIWNAASGNYTSVVSSATSYIPVGQALMVLATNDAAPTLSVNNTARVHSSQAFYKSGSNANQLTINATANNYADETVVHFIGEGTEGFDLQVDGMKLPGLDEAPQLYTVAAGLKFSISNLPEFPEQVAVPVNFETKYTGTVTLTFSQVESFPATMSIKLEDKLTGQMINLRQQSTYTFAHQQGNAADRFVLHFGGATGVDEPGIVRGKIWISENTVNIYSPATVGERALVEIFNTAGQVVFNKQVMLSELTRIPVTLGGIAVVRVTTSKEVMVKKGFFR
ncbi:MAG: YDG domain-containing protein [Bacteroidetes bacterium]|nr:YDG domain-containing protein [Bacteroidota bacterium]